MLDVMRHHALFPMPPEVTQVILGGGSPIDLDSLRIQDLGPEERKALRRTLAIKTPGKVQNPFSSKEYSAIQFTARTLVRRPSPATQALETLQTRLQAMGDPGLPDLVRIPELIEEQEAFAFFFAHEVQVMEQSGFQSSRSGPASHSEYKQRQRDAARRRVLQGILQEEPC